MASVDRHPYRAPGQAPAWCLPHPWRSMCLAPLMAAPFFAPAGRARPCLFCSLKLLFHGVAVPGWAPPLLELSCCRGLGSPVPIYVALPCSTPAIAVVGFCVSLAFFPALVLATPQVHARPSSWTRPLVQVSALPARHRLLLHQVLDGHRLPSRHCSTRRRSNDTMCKCLAAAARWLLDEFPSKRIEVTFGPGVLPRHR